MQGVSQSCPIARAVLSTLVGAKQRLRADEKRNARDVAWSVLGMLISSSGDIEQRLCANQSRAGSSRHIFIAVVAGGIIDNRGRVSATRQRTWRHNGKIVLCG